MTSEQIWGIIRTILAAGAGYLSAKGVIDAGAADTIIGAVGTIFVAGWSIYAKRKVA